MSPPLARPGLRTRKHTTDKTHAPDGSLTISEIDRRERTWADKQPLVIRCILEDCEWRAEGLAADVREEAKEHRAANHPGVLGWVRGTLEEHPRKAAKDAGREALERMDTGEPQVPGGPPGEEEPAEPGGGDREGTGSPEAAQASPADAVATASSSSPGGRPKRSREDILREIKARAIEDGHPPPARTVAGQRLRAACKRIGVKYGDLVEEAGFARPTKGTRYGKRKPLDAAGGTIGAGPPPASSGDAEEAQVEGADQAPPERAVTEEVDEQGSGTSAGTAGAPDALSHVGLAARAADLLVEVLVEVDRQDEKHGLYEGTRRGRLRARLALATLEDEVAEALLAWREERAEEGWPKTRAEVLQVAAVAVRALRDAL